MRTSPRLPARALRTARASLIQIRPSGFASARWLQDGFLLFTSPFVLPDLVRRQVIKAFAGS